MRQYIMQVCKWGNSLAVRLPAVVVEALDLKEGDEIEITVAGKREFEVARDRSREKALAAIRRLARPFPPGFKFDREEANER
jgi:antitoxin MazE